MFTLVLPRWRNLQTYRQRGGEYKHLRRGGAPLLGACLTLEVCSYVAFVAVLADALQYVMFKEYARAP
jgi:hypothetical protein